MANKIISRDAKCCHFQMARWSALPGRKVFACRREASSFDVAHYASGRQEFSCCASSVECDFHRQESLVASQNMLVSRNHHAGDRYVTPPSATMMLAIFTALLRDRPSLAASRQIASMAVSADKSPRCACRRMPIWRRFS